MIRKKVIMIAAMISISAIASGCGVDENTDIQIRPDLSVEQNQVTVLNEEIKDNISSTTLAVENTKTDVSYYSGVITSLTDEIVTSVNEIQNSNFAEETKLQTTKVTEANVVTTTPYVKSETTVETTVPVTEITEQFEKTTETENISVISPDKSPEYINGILIVNKTYSVGENYEPSDMVCDEDGDYLISFVMDAFKEMKAAAKEEGLNLWVQSGYRSYSTQARIYNNNVNRDGKAAADRYSARPGSSEHQTGLAFDLNSIEDSFAFEPEGIWVAEHCYEYGFIIRYPKGKEEQTGYMYEPWHLRYLGVQLATDVYNSGLCLEEYLGIDSVYPD